MGIPVGRPMGVHMGRLMGIPHARALMNPKIVAHISKMDA